MARTEGINTKDSDFEYLRKYKRGSFPKLLLIIVLLFALGIFYLKSLTTNFEKLQSAKSDLLRSNSILLIETYEAERAWLSKHGITSEIKIFDIISNTIFTARLQNKTIINNEIAVGFIRLVFLLLASWRFCFFAAILGFFLSKKTLEDYHAKDFLGQTGSGRLFFSGIRVGLGKRAANGEPTQLVTGLACPKRATNTQLKNSQLYKVLSHWQVLNETNESLASIVIALNSAPAFIADKSNKQELDDTYLDQGLIKHTSLILEQVLRLHSSYQTSSVVNSENNEDLSRQNLPFNAEQYANLLGQLFHRVLTPLQRESLSSLDSKLIATCILALQAGKSLVYKMEAGEWLQISNFPQLSSRAVLHSIAGFGEEYDHFSRQTIRRALIYASRRSAFGPVRFAEDLNVDSRALRQWIELCLANPHELFEVADEVELFGLVGQGYQAWVEEFYKDLDQEADQEIYATKTNLLFVPVSRIVRQAAKALNAKTISRLDVLVQKISARQLAYQKRLANTSTEENLEEIPFYDRVNLPLDKDQIAKLADMHNCEAKDLRVWSAIQIVLNSYGWLSRRVGDYTVPDHSVIFAVLRTGEKAPGANQFGLVGKTAMIPLRGHKLEYKFGRAWKNKFPLSFTATMAESRDVFEKLMQGQDKDELLGIKFE